MPKLDFLTLYIVIFLNSLMVCTIWTAIAVTYRSLIPARIWLASTVVVLVGGVILSLQGNEGAFWPAVIGNTVIIYGFCLSWIGARYFYGRRNGWRFSLAFSLASFACMAAFHSSWEGRNVVYAVGQSVPMAMTALYVFRRKHIGLGGGIAIAALVLGIAGHAVETALNLAAWWGRFGQELYFAAESYALVCVIYSGVIWNFGFIVMAMNRQYGEMVRMAETDELTGLPNRRHFMSRLEAAEQDFAENGTHYALMLIDIDNFKQLNDTYGHAAGDWALVHFAGVSGAIVKDLVKDRAVLARTGGDEFSVLLTDMGEAAAAGVAQAIIAALRGAPLVLGGRRRHMTVSIGIAAQTEGLGQVPELLDRADLALYRVKQAGRDGYATADETVSGAQPVLLRLVGEE